MGSLSDVEVGRVWATLGKSEQVPRYIIIEIQCIPGQSQRSVIFTGRGGSQNFGGSGTFLRSEGDQKIFSN